MLGSTIVLVFIAAMIVALVIFTIVKKIRRYRIRKMFEEYLDFEEYPIKNNMSKFYLTKTKIPKYYSFDKKYDEYDKYYIKEIKNYYRGK